MSEGELKKREVVKVVKNLKQKAYVFWWDKKGKLHFKKSEDMKIWT